MNPKFHNPDKCFATGKKRFYGSKEAKEALLKIKGISIYNHITKKRVKKGMGKPKQCRYYYCIHCKGYHLTSQEVNKTKQTILEEKKKWIKTTKGLIISPEEAQEWKQDSLPFPTTPEEKENLKNIN